MIDERQEELASLYALDLLEGAERAQFEATLARDQQLQQLVRELREAGAQLAHTAPAATPPPALRARVLAAIDAPAARPGEADNVIPGPWSGGLLRLFPWAIAACFAFAAGLVGLRYVAVRTERDLARREAEVAETQLKLERLRLERDRLLANESLSRFTRQLATANNQLGDANRQLADAREQLGERDRRIGTLNQRIDTLAGASAEIGRQLGEAKERIAALERDADVAHLKITTLASLLDNSPQALAVAVWNPDKQGGVIQVGGLPTLAPNQDYQLWVVDEARPQLPVDGGVFTVDAKGNARLEFTAKEPVKAVAAFAISRERKGGVPKAEGPIVLLGK